MGTEDMKKCPFCAEMIKEEAIKCRYCGSNLSRQGINMDLLSTPGHWQRVNEGKKIAGVCTGLARQFNEPMLILPLRLFFILTTIFYGFGLVLYILLWILMLAPTDMPGAGKKPDAKPAGEEKNDTTTAPAGKKARPVDLFLGFVLIVLGVIFLFLTLSYTSSKVHMGLPHFLSYLPFAGFFSHGAWHPSWTPSLWTVLIVVGLLLVILGGVKLIRVALGCALIAIGSVLLIIFIPFMPRLFFFPGLFLVGLLLIILGGVKLALGSR